MSSFWWLSFWIIINYDWSIFRFSSCSLFICLAIDGIADFLKLTVFASGMEYFSFLLRLMLCFFMFCWNINLVLAFFTHLFENLKLNFSLLSCNVSSCNSFSFSSYGLLLFVMSLTATFCTPSNSFLFFCVIEELHTTLDCSMTL